MARILFHVDVANDTARVEYEASTSKIADEQLFYLQQRGIREEEVVSLIVNGFCRSI